MNKVGYDRFGNNELFAPMMKWEVFKEQVEVIKDRAETFENAYNAIKESITRHDDVKTIVKALPRTTRLQVVKQKNRLEEARRVAVSEKGAYVLVSVETSMSNIYRFLSERAPTCETEISNWSSLLHFSKMNNAIPAIFTRNTLNQNTFVSEFCQRGHCIRRPVLL